MHFGFFKNLYLYSVLIYFFCSSVLTYLTNKTNKGNSSSRVTITFYVF